ncbi:MAG: VWA domain-containing protein [Anaerolineaceae bacterium]|nr:VWA domain-containing protein [Anaerolineaceae bacterium]
MTNKKLEMTAGSDLELINDSMPTERILEITVTAPQGSAAHRQKLNLSLVIDRSGSMGGSKIEYAKQAAAHVLDLLNQDDRVSVITFDDVVSTLAEATQVTPQARREIQERIRTIRPGGSTNLGEGWLTGCNQIASSLATDTLNRSLLLTDGHANVGITGIEELGTHARQLNQRGVSTSTFGIGEGYQEFLLEQMANLGGGNFYYIETPQLIPDIFARELNEVLSVTARGVEISIEIPKKANISVVGDWRFEEGKDSLRVILGDLSSNMQRTLYFKALLPPKDKKGDIELKIKAIARDENDQVQEIVKTIQFRYDDPAVIRAAKPEKELMERFSGVALAKITSDALKLDRDGRHAEAEKLMDMGITSYAACMPAPAASQFRQIADQIKYGMNETQRKVNHRDMYQMKQNRMRDIDTKDKEEK